MARTKLVQQLNGSTQAALNQAKAEKQRKLGYTDPVKRTLASDAAAELRGDLGDDRIIGRAYPRERIPTRVTTEKYLLSNPTDLDDTKGRKIIDLWVNPSGVNWTMPRREALQKTRTGGVRYSWRQRAKSKKKKGPGTGYYDELQVQFTFQSGSILSVAGGEMAGAVPPGLDDFYAFMALCNEPKLLDDGRENWHVVVHTSPIFPKITLKGWFTPEGISVSESSDQGFGMQWTATMEVHRTYPPVWDQVGLQVTYGDPSL